MKRSGHDQGEPITFLADGMSRGEIEFLHDEGQIEDERYDALIEDLDRMEFELFRRGRTVADAI